MKKGFIYIGILLAGLGLTACDDFLMEDSDDLLIPESVEDYILFLCCMERGIPVVSMMRSLG